MNEPQSKLKQVVGHFDETMTAEGAIREQTVAVLDNFCGQLRSDESRGIVRSLRGVARINFTGGGGGRFVLDMRLLPTKEIAGDELARIVDEHIAAPLAEGGAVTQGEYGDVSQVHAELINSLLQCRQQLQNLHGRQLLISTDLGGHTAIDATESLDRAEAILDKFCRRCMNFDECGQYVTRAVSDICEECTENYQGENVER